MKKLMMTMVVVMCAVTVALAAGGSKRKSIQAMVGNLDGPETSGRAAKVLIEQAPKIGSQACLTAPSVSGASLIGQCYKKPRKWIVLETRYATFGTDTSRFLDQLTFTWHVLLDAKSNATENKGNRDNLSQYSYFTTSVTYYNIPQGSHASSVCLPPSYLERFGEAKAVGVEITNQNGDTLGGTTISEIKAIPNDTKFWENQKLMNEVDKKSGKPYVERRQGLLDRSKTIWAMVNPNDYETTIQ